MATCCNLVASQGRGPVKLVNTLVLVNLVICLTTGRQRRQRWWQRGRQRQQQKQRP
jgi:hypothetical protein